MKRISLVTIFALTLFLSFCQISFAGVITGRVIHVADGDTITVRDASNRKHKIRLYGIDCPESGQEFGKEAARFTTRLASGKMARVTQYDRDRYGRVVGVVLVDGVNVNQSLIENGYAWKYGRYCKEPFCQDWRRLEERAKGARVGLWTDDAPAAPWDWRRNRRQGKPSAAESRQSGWGESKRIDNGSYSGNVNSRVFHAPDCKHFHCKNCTESFIDREQAVKKGYRPCGMCLP